MCLGNVSKDFSLLNTTNTFDYIVLIIKPQITRYSQIFDGKEQYEIIFGFIKKCFFTAMSFFNLSNVNSLEYVSMNNQECKIRPEIININTNEPDFYHYSIEINKCKGSCNTINDPYAKICVPDNIKNTNVKVFNLMSRTDEKRHIK